MWVEPDTNMPTGESLVRQLLYGQLYFERTFGARSRVCWLPDCFGFSPALPQLLRQAGVELVLHDQGQLVGDATSSRTTCSGGRGSTARACSPTLSTIRWAATTAGSASDAYLPTWANFRGKAHHDETLLAVGFGDGGGGVTPEMIERQRQLEDFPVLPSARWGTRRANSSRARTSERRARELPSGPARSIWSCTARR